MTEEKFIELFGEHPEQYIKIEDLKKILVTGETKVYDFLVQNKTKIWGPKDQTYFTALRALQRVFNDGWENTLTFEELIKDFRKLTYLKGVGKQTLQNITDLCIMSGQKISGEMQRYNRHIND